jgi:hypothetical protein
MPTFGADAPLQYYDVPIEERERRCSLGSDDCVIDEEFFFIRGCLDIPVIGEQDSFSWGVWVSLSKENFAKFIQHFDQPKRSHIGPFFRLAFRRAAALSGYRQSQDPRSPSRQRAQALYRG